MSSKVVHLYPKRQYGSTDIDVIAYCKRKGEHLLAVKVRAWLNGDQKKGRTALSDLRALCSEHGDLLNEF